MDKKLMHLVLAAMLLAAVPLAAGAEENINIYAWQDWSLEYVDKDSRDYDRVTNNAANIGFMAHLDTGIDGLQVGFRCEQYTYFNQRAAATGGGEGDSGWCQRNSKISLRDETLGEIMYAQWLLPYNEIFAQWVDPYYDADVTSHSNLMGNLGNSASSVGSSAGYYVGGFGAYGQLSFNRRQDGVIMYVWPNTADMASQSRDGFQFRIAVTDGSNVDQDVAAGDISYNHDPRIWSTGVSWQQNLANGGQVWMAVAYELHDDWSANSLAAEAVCDDSNDEGYRLAGRYKHDWGNGQSTWIAAMYEELDYDADGCVTPDAAAKLNPNGTTTAAVPGGDVTAPVWSDVERDAWMISGKHSFGNGFDFRFLYADADEWECGINCNDDDTDAEAFSVGVSYTMPAGTELRLTYSEIDNGDRSQYDFGIGGVATAEGEDAEVIGLGIVHWFD